MAEIIFFENKEITVKRKNIKNIYLRVYPPEGSVHISIPTYVSEKEILRFLDTKKEWIEASRLKMAKKKLNYKEWTNDELKNSEIYLQEKIPFYIKKWEKIMNVKVDSWYTRHMKTRWGSCHISKKRICINLSLSQIDEKILEYIIVHEMIHLKERYHNKNFYKYMDKYLPDWKLRKKVLLES